jgi:CRISPR-associated protein Csm2
MTYDRGPRTGGVTSTAVPDEATLKKIIVDGDVEALITWAETIGNGLARNERLTTAQMRGFFGMVRQIEAEADAESQRSEQLLPKLHRRLSLLKPKLAYQAERDRESRRGEGVLRLKQVLTPAIDLVQGKRAHFKHLVEFFEAIVAYHKAAGGRES